MSAPTAEAALAPRRERALGVLGAGLALVLLIGILVWLWISRSRPVDAAQQLQTSFAIAGVPEGWTVMLAQSVPGSLLDFGAETRMVRLQRNAAAPPGEPTRLFFDWFDASTGPESVARQLDSHRAVAVEQAQKEGGTVRVDSGKLAWGTREVPFVHERYFEKAKSRDAWRVDLSFAGEYLVLNMLWDWGGPASREAAQRVLQLFPPPKS